MASQNVEALIPCKQDSGFYLEQDVVNRLVTRMKVITKDVDMGDLFHKFIQCAKYQTQLESEDYLKLVATITLVKEQLDKDDYLELLDTITRVKELLGTV
jgi:hypothetical protein